MIQTVTRFLSAALIGVILAAATTSRADESPAHNATRVPLPKVQIFRGAECVEPEEVMRRDHMEMILHQRDKTVHEGIRTTKYSLKECINCHANPETNSVLGKDGFCVTCHQYAAVSIDCFTCHSNRAEPNAVGLPALNRLTDLMNRSKTDMPSPQVSLPVGPAEPAGMSAP